MTVQQTPEVLVRKLMIGASMTLALVAAAGCAARPQADASVAASATASATELNKKEIVHIVSRSRTVTVSSSSRGLLYSLKDADGRVQIADASERKFAELEPELYRSIKQYIAVKNDDAPIATGSADAAIPTADVRHDGPSLNVDRRGFRGSSSGASADQFNRTSDRPFPTAREDAER